MTLEEAIKHAEEVAEQNEWFEKNCLESMQCKECAEGHRQLAEWLKDYKRLLEQEPKTGHWKRIGYDIYECSICGQNVMTGDICAYRYCHCCGTRMIESEK